jgi:hypothetical protein
MMLLLCAWDCTLVEDLIRIRENMDVCGRPFAVSASFISNDEDFIGCAVTVSSSKLLPENTRVTYPALF